MTVVIVDTDVVSYLFKGDTRGALYEPHLAGALPAISFMTLAELEQWTILHNWGARRHAELLRFVKDRFIVVDSNDALCRKWAEVRGATASVGRKIENADGWMAATALVYDATLVTHNSDDFAAVPGLTPLSLKGTEAMGRQGWATILEGECDLTDDAAPEYDFAEMHRMAKEQGREYRGILSGKGVRLAPDVAEVFSTSEAVNEALRTMTRVMRQEMKIAA